MILFLKYHFYVYLYNPSEEWPKYPIFSFHLCLEQLFHSDVSVRMGEAVRELTKHHGPHTQDLTWPPEPCPPLDKEVFPTLETSENWWQTDVSDTMCLVLVPCLTWEEQGNRTGAELPSSLPCAPSSLRTLWTPLPKWSWKGGAEDQILMALPWL